MAKRSNNGLVGWRVLVLRALRTVGPHTPRQLEAELGAPYRSVMDALHWLHSKKLAYIKHWIRPGIGLPGAHVKGKYAGLWVCGRMEHAPKPEYQTGAQRQQAYRDRNPTRYRVRRLNRRKQQVPDWTFHMVLALVPDLTKENLHD